MFLLISVTLYKLRQLRLIFTETCLSWSQRRMSTKPAEWTIHRNRILHLIYWYRRRRRRLAWAAVSAAVDCMASEIMSSRLHTAPGCPVDSARAAAAAAAADAKSLEKSRLRDLHWLHCDHAYVPASICQINKTRKDSIAYTSDASVLAAVSIATQPWRSWRRCVCSWIVNYQPAKKRYFGLKTSPMKRCIARVTEIR